MTTQYALPLHRFADVDVRSGGYRRGFQAGFVAATRAQLPDGLPRNEAAGWLDGHSGSQVPAWRMEDGSP